MARQDQNLFERDACKQQVHRERLPKTMKALALDARGFEGLRRWNDRPIFAAT
jgi:hypothetical protein